MEKEEYLFCLVEKQPSASINPDNQLLKYRGFDWFNFSLTILNCLKYLKFLEFK
uniref:Uncharacterized protein n=1 Tax=Phlebia radiata TaxID=5308 RepID=L8B9G7_PHLRA|nr:hypothetical protein Pra_mt0301 [Phlebia radiata]CCF07369.1 hypothetical protein Pra_mt0301 [Phlebia radiata]